MSRRFWSPSDAGLVRVRLTHQLRRWGLLYLLMAASAVWFDSRYTVGLNATESLPERLFLIDRTGIPGRGDLVAFRWPGGGPYPKGATFIKRIAGVPGDTVMAVEGDFFVNCVPVGTAKPTSRQGIPLERGPTGTLPPSTYYVRAPHPDSLDSRYALTGWITRAQIIGRAHALF